MTDSDENADSLGPQQVEACDLGPESDGKCEVVTLYNIAAVKAGADEKDGGGGVLAPPGSCYSILGTSGTDVIYIGSLYTYTGGVWVTSGGFAYCKNNVRTQCTSVADQLPVKPYQGDDVVRVPAVGSLYQCPEGSSYAIGPWESLSSTFQLKKLNVYGCAGVDHVFTTPNADTVIGGSGTDYIYGRGGADLLCGGYGTFTGHECAFCDSGANCTSSNGYDTALDEDDLVRGDAGDDVICGVDGGDNLQGYEGNDHIYGMSGCDYIIGNEGNDTIYAAKGSSGSDLDEPACPINEPNELVGGDGDDILHGSNTRDSIWGETFDPNTASEEDGADTIYGYGSPDKLCPGGSLWGHDVVYGGSGNDTIIYYLSDAFIYVCFPGGDPPLPPNPGACLGSIADGGSGDDKLLYRGIYCLDCLGDPDYDLIICPELYCLGGVTLNGGTHTTDDCCDCGDISGSCSYFECEVEVGYHENPCGVLDDSGLPDFSCPFPYFYTWCECE